MFRRIFGRRTVMAFAAGALVSFAGSGPVAAQQPKELRVLVFGGTLGSGFMKAIAPFEKENNVKFSVTNSTAVQGVTRLLARAGQAPEWDIVHMSPSAHFMGAEAGIWEEVSPKTVPNMADLYPFAVDRGKYAGWGVLAFGLSVNTEALKKAGVPEPTSWRDLWKPEFKGRVAVYDFANAYAQAFLDVVAQLEGSQDKAFAALKKLRPNVSRFPFTPAELDNALLQQDVWVAPNSDSRTNLLASQGAPLKFINPKEGSGAWMVYLDIPKGTPNKDLALKLMNYVLSPDVQAQLALDAEVGPVNRKTQLSEQAKAKGLAFGEAVEHMMPLHWENVVPNLQDLTDRWNRDFQN